MIINSELFLRTFQIIESGPLPILFILHPYYAKRSHRRKTCPGEETRENQPVPGRKASLPATGILAPATVVTQKDHY